MVLHCLSNKNNGFGWNSLSLMQKKNFAWIYSTLDYIISIKLRWFKAFLLLEYQNCENKNICMWKLKMKTHALLVSINCVVFEINATIGDWVCFVFYCFILLWFLPGGGIRLCTCSCIQCPLLQTVDYLWWVYSWENSRYICISYYVIYVHDC